MLYKTMVLEMLQERPQIHERLRRERKLLATLNLYAGTLKARHQFWKEHFQKAKPNSSQSQIASEALELALKELEDFLPSESEPTDDEPLSLDEAITFIKRHMPHA